MANPLDPAGARFEIGDAPIRYSTAFAAAISAEVALLGLWALVHLLRGTLFAMDPGIAQRSFLAITFGSLVTGVFFLLMRKSRWTRALVLGPLLALPIVFVVAANGSAILSWLR